MKIGIVTNFLHSKSTGIEKYNENLIRLFLSKNWIITEYFTHKIFKPIDEFAKNDCYAMKFLYEKTPNITFFRKSFLVSKLLKKIIEENDILIISGGEELTHCKILNQNNVLYVQHFDQRMYTNSILTTRMKIIKRIISFVTPLNYRANFIWNATNVVFFDKSCVPRKSNVLNKFFILVPNSLKNDNWNLNSNLRTKITYIGRLEKRQKNVNKLVKKMSSFPGLEIYGQGKLKRKLEKRCPQIYKGFANSNELNDVYIKTKCLLLPSLYEGCPTVVSEAASFGIPTISFNNYDMARFWEKKGVIIIAKNWNNFVSKAREIINMDSNKYLEISTSIQRKSKIADIKIFNEKWLNIIYYLSKS